MLTEQHLAQRVVVAEAGKRGIAAVGGFGRRRVGTAAVLAHEPIGFGSAAVVHAQFVPGAGQVAGHRVAHDAQAQERNAARPRRRAHAPSSAA